MTTTAGPSGLDRPSRHHPTPLAPLLAFLAAVAAAAALRLVGLTAEPLHHDEGVNGWFIHNILFRGDFRYDPENYHGPHLFYMHAVLSSLFGESVLIMRLPVALAGLGCVALVWGLREAIGRWSAAAAAWLLATSPALVYYNRLFIHESYLAVAFLGVVVLWVRYQRAPSLPMWLALMALVGWSLTIKETDIVTYGVLAIAAALAWLFAFGYGPRSAGWMERVPGMARGDRLQRLQAQLGVPAQQARWLLLPRPGERGQGMVVGLLLMVVIFLVSYVRLIPTEAGGIGLDLGGALDKFRALVIWGKTGFSSFHGKPWTYFPAFLLSHEFILAGAALIGAVAALWARNVVALLMAGWGIGLVMAYSIPSYKTPWLIMTQLVPLAVAGGFGLSAVAKALARLAPRGRRPAVTTVVSLAVLAPAGVSAWVAVQIAHRPFLDQDGERPYARSGYIYAHSYTGARPVLEALDSLARTPAPPEVAVIDPSMWPLPWYARHYPVRYYSLERDPQTGGIAEDQPWPATFEVPIILADHAQRNRVFERLPGDRRYLQQVFAIRPGFSLLAVFRPEYAPLFRQDPVVLEAEAGSP